MRQRECRPAHVWRALSFVLAAVLLVAGDARAQAVLLQAPEPQPLDDFSPSFLGMYRKVMEIEDTIRRHAATYGVDPDLALAVCLYESGGNAGLSSNAGAQGYFQVMPRTFRTLRTLRTCAPCARALHSCVTAECSPSPPAPISRIPRGLPAGPGRGAAEVYTLRIQKVHSQSRVRPARSLSTTSRSPVPRPSGRECSSRVVVRPRGSDRSISCPEGGCRPGGGSSSPPPQS